MYGIKEFINKSLVGDMPNDKNRGIIKTDNVVYYEVSQIESEAEE